MPKPKKSAKPDECQDPLHHERFLLAAMLIGQRVARLGNVNAILEIMARAMDENDNDKKKAREWLETAGLQALSHLAKPGVFDDTSEVGGFVCTILARDMLNLLAPEPRSDEPCQN